MGGDIIAGFQKLVELMSSPSTPPTPSPRVSAATSGGSQGATMEEIMEVPPVRRVGVDACELGVRSSSRSWPYRRRSRHESPTKATLTRRTQRGRDANEWCDEFGAWPGLGASGRAPVRRGRYGSRHGPARRYRRPGRASRTTRSDPRYRSRDRRYTPSLALASTARSARFRLTTPVTPSITRNEGG